MLQSLILTFQQPLNKCRTTTTSYTVSSVGLLKRNSTIIWSLYMIKEAEITNQTGIVYLREGLGNDITVNLLSSISSWTSTGEAARSKPNTQPELSQSLQPYK